MPRSSLSFEVFDGGVLVPCEDDKIFYPIVKRVAIDVMDMFPSLQFTAKKLLHYIAMFAHEFPINRKLFVPVRWLVEFFPAIFRKLSEMNLCQAALGAIFGFLNSMTRNIKFFATIQARYIDAVARSYHPRSAPKHRTMAITESPTASPESYCLSALLAGDESWWFAWSSSWHDAIVTQVAAVLSTARKSGGKRNGKR